MAKIVSSIVKANKNYVKKSISQLSTRLTLIAAAPYATLVAPPLNPIPIPIPLFWGFSALTSVYKIPNLNPCHHLFFGVVEPERNSPGARFEASCADLKQLLPLAWSHDPLTTLKLIRNLMVPYHTDYGDQKFNKAFYLSMNWLHQNHPKTFISNLAPFTEVYGNFFFLAKMLCFLLEGQKFLERYEHDPHYKLLYDSVCDFFVENFKCDIEKLKRQKLKHPDINPGMDNLFGRNISMAGNSFFDYDMRPISMFQSIAVKLFPRESDPEFQGLEEADYKGRVWSQFYEVLGPLAIASDTQYEYRDPIEPPAHKTYLERLKADKSMLRADALLPNQIIAYVHHWDFGKVAELQWNAMVEDIKKQGNNMILNNCLVLCGGVNPKFMCEDSVEVSITLGLLVSQLSQKPWKGKVINYHEDSPQLELIQGGDDLRYKCEFVRRRMITCNHPDFSEMFDLILEEAVKRNLKPEQMVKKVFVFNHPGFERFLIHNVWECIYNNIKSKFGDKGYGNVVPHFVHWNLSEYKKNKPVIPYKQPGLTVLTGFSNKLFKLFLENDGEFGPEHVMEVAISGDEFQSLAVVD